MNVEAEVGLHEITHVYGVLGDEMVWEREGLGDAVGLHVELVNWLTTVIIYDINLATNSGYEQILRIS